MHVKCDTLTHCESFLLRCPLCKMTVYLGDFYGILPREKTCSHCGMTFHGVMPDASEINDDEDPDEIEPDYYYYDTNQLTELITERAGKPQRDKSWQNKDSGSQ